jgi:hypothetical protein
MTARGSFTDVCIPTSFRGVSLLALSHQLWLRHRGSAGPLPRFGSFICRVRRMGSWNEAPGLASLRVCEMLRRMYSPEPHDWQVSIVCRRRVANYRIESYSQN